MRFRNTDLPDPTSFSLEKHLLTSSSQIETWFDTQWASTPMPFYASVDLRHAGFKLAPIDTNLFPAGFNNLHPENLELCKEAMGAFKETWGLSSQPTVLILSESHTRNVFYFEHLYTLQAIFADAGYRVYVGSLTLTGSETQSITLSSGHTLALFPIRRLHNTLYVEERCPDVIVLNNDLSEGLPALLENITQPITPPPHAGWQNRLKSQHFEHYTRVSQQLADHIGIDPWRITPLYTTCSDVDFRTGHGTERLVELTTHLFEQIAAKYRTHGIKKSPFVVIKSDAGTYGMAVLPIKSPEKLRALNRKERKNMSSIKGGRTVSQVILQEGVYTSETSLHTGFVAEPVIYLIGARVVGGFYRVNPRKHADENLNSPGMQFEPFVFPSRQNLFSSLSTQSSHFYAYSVVARLAALAAGRELL